jgi:GT2 family glycosyltransferase
MTSVTLVAVTHRSVGFLPAAVETFRAEAKAAGAEAELVVVDHSEDPAELDRLAACAPDRLVARPNRGYAAGINAGVATAGGEILLLANPDLHFRPGSVAALLAALDAGWDLAGPQFELAGFLFPPADRQTPAETIARARAGRSRRAWGRGLARAAARWREVWESPGPVAVPALSGALIAVRAETARALGPWDEGYFLYFEETDWLRRAAARGLRTALAPAARVEHRWGHAAVPDRTAGVYAASRRRFQDRHHPRLGPPADRLARALAARATPFPTTPFPALPPAPGRRLDWLVSPSPLLLPAAGRRGEEPPIAAYATFAAAAPSGSGLAAAAVDPEDGTVYGPWTCPAPPT